MATSTDVVSWIGDQLEAALDGKEVEGLLAVVASAVRSGELEVGEGIVTIATLLTAGGESTTSVLGNALHILATDAHLQSRLHAPAEFDRPDEVVLDRPAPRHHLGFGRGIHLCVGAPLARLEAESSSRRCCNEPGTSSSTLIAPRDRSTASWCAASTACA